MRNALRLPLVLLTLASLAFAGVTVSSPVNGSTVTSPTHIVASASSSNPITAMRIYVDGNSVFSTSSSRIDTYISMSGGSHLVVVQAWDSTGAVFKAPLNLNVAGTSANGVIVTSPINGSSSSSPVHFTAYAKAANPVVAMKIYSDGNVVFSTSASSLDTYVSLAGGQHYVVVQAWDSTGAVYKAPAMTINVGSASGSGTTIPSGAKTFANIEQMPGWEHCTTCAGAGGNGPVAQYSMTQGISNPSVDGNAAQFWIGGTTPYSDALWWKQLGGNNSVSHFVYDLYFYVKQPQYAQALEFDVNQSVGGKKYIMGVQCNIKDSKQWDVWDGLAQTWRPTGVACAQPPAYTWNHLTEEFVRDNSGHVTFVAVTLNGLKSYINRTYGSLPSGVSEVNVAFQMDGDYAQHGFLVWLDKVKLTYW
jgi:hypothetical protein